MLIFHAFRESYQYLRNHKWRAISMGFGVWWSMALLMLLLAASHAMQRGISAQFEKYGARNLILYDGWHKGKRYAMPKEVATNLSGKLGGAIQQAACVHNLGRSTLLQYKDKAVKNIGVSGFDSSYASITYVALAEGRFFTPYDEAAAGPICVLGDRLKSRLFGDASALGKYVLLDGIGLQVVGVLDDSSRFDGNSESLLLVNSFLSKLFPAHTHSVSPIYLSLAPVADEAICKTQLRTYFARHLNVDAQKLIKIFSTSEHAQSFHTFFKTLSGLIWLLGFFLLMVGLVNLSNMVILSIHERTQEIAVRRILGASSGHIMAMTFAEITLIVTIAVLLAFSFGFVVMALLNIWVVPLYKSYYLTPLRFSMRFIGYSVGLLVLTGYVAGLFPVRRAMRIKPMEGLRDV